MLCHFEIFNTGAYAAGNFKTLPLMQFFSDDSQTSCGHWLPWWNTGYRGIIFLANRPSFNNFAAFWNFNMGVNGKILKCVTSSKRLTVERNGWIFVTHGPMYCICRALFMSDPLRGIWSDSVHFAIFPMLKFSKSYCSHTFIQFQQRCMESMVIRVKYKLLFFWLYAKLRKNIWHFDDNSPQLY